jgi:signal transduction histidine kinase/ligand-binding sensor domain-containing protein
MRFYTLPIVFLFFLLNSPICLSVTYPSLLSPIIYPAEANSHLSNKEIIELTQDKQGIMWVGTRRGVFKYDGYSYQKITFPSDRFDFSNIYVRALLANGNDLWIGSMSHGMFHLDLETYKITQYKQDNSISNSIAGDQVNDFAIDQQGTLWVANNRGLNIFDKNTHSFTLFRSSENPEDFYLNYLLDIEFNHQDQLWLSTGKGVAVYNKQSQSFKRVFQRTKTFEQDQLGCNNINLKDVIARKLFFAHDNRLWIASHKKGSFIIDLSESAKADCESVIRLAPDNPEQLKINTAIVQPTNHEIWISGVSGVEVRDSISGEIIRKLETNLLDKYSLDTEVVYAMFVSRSGLLWLGSRNIGLYYFNPHNNGFKRFNSFLPKFKEVFENYIDNVVRLSEEEIIILTHNQLRIVNLMDGSIEQLHANVVKQIGEISSIQILDKESILLGSYADELYKYNLVSKKVTSIPIPKGHATGERISLIEKSNTGVWLLKENRLFHLNLKTMQLNNVVNESGSQYESYVRDIHFDNNNRLWIATNKGIGLIKPNSFQVTTYSKESGTQGTLLNNYVTQITEDFNGTIFINTRSGINKFNNESQRELLLEPFAQEATSQIHHDELLFSNSDGTYWFGARFHLNENGDILSEYGISDGLIENQRGKAILSIDEKTMLYASSGVVIFNPQELKPWQHQPPIVVTEFNIDEKMVLAQKTNKGVHLQPEDSGFSVRFSALDYTTPKSNSYRYKLEGHDENWIYTPSDIRQAKYTSLAPGKYKLLLDGSNRNGLWSASPLEISVLVEPKYYQTIWFLCIIILSIMVLIYLIFRWRLSVIKHQMQQVHEKEDANRRAQMMAEMVIRKNQLLADVSHELRTPLTVLQLKVEALQHNLIEDVDVEYEGLMTKIGDVNSLITDIYQLSQSDIGALELNKKSINCNDIINEWANEFAQLVRSKEFLWHQDIQLPNNLEVEFDDDKIKQVLSNLLGNSISYTDMPGKIILIANTIDNQLTITIEDSAPGVESENLPKIFERLFRVETSRSRALGGSGLGLSICKSIVEAHQGNITSAESALGGLSIIISLPIELTKKKV